MARPVDTMRFEVRGDKRFVEGSGTYMDGSEYFGGAEFEAEYGMTFAEFGRRMVDGESYEGPTREERKAVAKARKAA